MTKRLIDIDDELFAAAQRLLGTASAYETVNASLRETIRLARCRAITHDDLVKFADASRDRGNPEIMAKAWSDAGIRRLLDLHRLRRSAPLAGGADRSRGCRLR